MESGTKKSSINVKIRSLEDLKDFREPESDCASLKSILIHLGIADGDDDDYDDIHRMIMTDSVVWPDNTWAFSLLFG
jgi:hypothetical protein